MELYVWKGDWGLPSISPDCLAVLAYCKFSGATVSAKITNVPFKNFSSSLPVFYQEATKLTSIQEIFTHLRKQRKGADFNLSEKQSADSLAYTALLTEKLVPALEHMWWIDEQNYKELTRSTYASALMFPLGVFVPSRMSKNVREKLFHTKGGDFLTDQDREKQLYKDAKEALNVLSTLLGDKSYFFGETPCSLDALVFGYLAPLLKAPLANTTLQNHLNGCPNLCAFCKRILDTYFPLSKKEEDDLREAEEKRRQKRQEATEFPNQKRNTILASFVALGAMATFAWFTGMIRVPGGKGSGRGRNGPGNRQLQNVEFDEGSL